MFQESVEPIGEVFQDERNMAAILMRRQLESGDLLMVKMSFCVHINGQEFISLVKM